MVEPIPEEALLTVEDKEDIIEVANDFGPIAAAFLLQVRDEKNKEVEKIFEFKPEFKQESKEVILPENPQSLIEGVSSGGVMILAFDQMMQVPKVFRDYKLFSDSE